MKYKSFLDGIVRTNMVPSVTDKPRLHAGERTVPYPEKFIESFLATLTPNDFLEYPNTAALQQRIADKHDVSIDQVFIANGSDYCLQVLFNVFVEPHSSVLMPEVHFPMYDVYLAQNQGVSVLMPYHMQDDKLTLKVDVTCVPSLIVVANPNSPVGDTLTIEQFHALRSYDAPVVVDQAYGEFGMTACDNSWLDHNFIFTHTFSKAFGAAGIRVGYAIANSRIIALMNKYRQMFEITQVSAKFTMWLLDNESVMQNYVKSIDTERQKFHNIGVQVQGGNWIHLCQETYGWLDKYYQIKSNARLPLIDKNLIRVTLVPGLFDFIHAHQSFNNHNR